MTEGYCICLKKNCSLRNTCDHGVPHEFSSVCAVSWGRCEKCVQSTLVVVRDERLVELQESHLRTSTSIP